MGQPADARHSGSLTSGFPEIGTLERIKLYKAADLELVAQAAAALPAMEVAAAWSMHETYSSRMMVGNTFTVDKESGDTVDYRLIDDGMEDRASLAD